MKNLLTIIAVALALSGCSSLKPAAAKSQSASPAGGGGSIEFLNNIAVGSPTAQDRQLPGGNAGSSAETLMSPVHGAIEAYSPLQFKYAILTNATVEEMDNLKLLNFMEQWYGIPYRYGGTGKDGIDCSAFVYSMLAEVYGINSLPRISREQYKSTTRVSKKELKEGDLVFFHTRGRHKAVTHVGVYLRNDKFIHASASGVMISDLNESYYAQRYIGAGRPSPSNSF